MSKAINEYCPSSGEPVSDDSLTTYKGYTVGFCNTGCRDKFENALKMFDGAIAKRLKDAKNEQ